MCEWVFVSYGNQGSYDKGVPSTVARMSYAEAERRFGIPRSTLSTWVTSKRFQGGPLEAGRGSWIDLPDEVPYVRKRRSRPDHTPITAVPSRLEETLERLSHLLEEERSERERLSSQYLELLGKALDSLRIAVERISPPGGG